MTSEQGKTKQAQVKVNRAYAKVLGAIKDVEALEKMACDAKDNDAAAAAGEILILLRQVKVRALAADGLLGVQIKPGGMTDTVGDVTTFSGST